MQVKVPEWLQPSPKSIVEGLVVAGVLAMISLIPTKLANPISDQDAISWFLYTLLILGAVWALSGIGALYWRRIFKRSPDATQLRLVPQDGQQQSSAATAEGKPEHVFFGLPTDWKVGPGFKLVTFPPDEFDKRDQAEEVRVFVHALRRMQNVEFELIASSRRVGGWKTVATIGSSKFAGVVHGDTKENFIVMRRTFRMVPPQYDDPFKGDRQEVAVRAEKNVTIFPDRSESFPARLGEQYRFEVRLKHDKQPNDLPEEASFVLDLHERLSVPQTRITDHQNIREIASGQPIEPSGIRSPPSTE